MLKCKSCSLSGKLDVPHVFLSMQQALVENALVILMLKTGSYSAIGHKLVADNRTERGLN